VNRSLKIHLLSATVIALVLFIFPTDSHAAWEYYTYGGYDAVLSAWQKVALIFSDNTYKALFFTVIAMGIFFAGLTFYLRAMGGLRAGPLSWAVPVGMGIVLYLGLVVPKDSLVIYDPVKNEGPASVSDVPLGIAATAGVLNKIESGLVDIVETASDPVGFRSNAGGVGFDIILNIGERQLLIPSYLQASLQQYTKDCLLYELTRPGATLTVDQLANNTDFVPLFEQANNPAIDTVYYSVANSAGDTMSCQDAWAAIKTDIISPTTFQNDVNNVCAQSGFDPTIPAELTECKTLASNVSSWIWGSSYTADTLRRQTAFARAIEETLLNASPNQAVQVLAAKQTGTSWLSMGAAANAWIPVLRATMTAVAIGILPFLVMFLPTPLFGRVIGIFAGMFIWLTTWGVVDAVVHSFAVDYAAKVAQELKLYNIGQVAVLSFGTFGLKTLAAFGTIRWSGLMLATVITAMLVKFGGYALAHLAGSLTGGAASGAAAAGHAVMDPKGMSSEVHGQASAAATLLPTYGWVNRPWSERTTGAALSMHAQTGGGMGYGSPEDAFNASYYGSVKSAGAGQWGQQFEREFTQQYQTINPTASTDEIRSTMGKFLAAGGINPIHAVEMLRAVGAEGLERILSAGTTDQMRRITDAEVFKAVAGMHGGVENFAGDLSAKNYTQAGEVINAYAESKGVSFDRAAWEIGRLLGDREALGAEAYEKVQNTVGRESQVFTEVNKGLNEVARFEQMYRFAKSAGYAGSREDFQGMYEAQKAHHAQETWTLDQERAAWLNDQMKARGIVTRFEAGDRVTLARMENGTISLAKGEGGASRETIDVSRITRGDYEHITMTSDELKHFAGELSGEGLTDAPKGLLEIARKGHGAELMFSRDSQGNIVSMSAKAGGDTAWKDFNMGQKGWEKVIEALKKTEKGTRSWTGRSEILEDTEKTVIGEGTVFDDTAFQMALKEDSALVRQVTNPYLSERQRDAEIVAIVAPLAKAAGQFATRSGASLDYTQGNAQLSVGAGGGLIFKANLGASGEVGGRRQDEKNTNLIAQQYEAIIRNDIAKAKEKGLTWQESEKLLSRDLSGYTRAFQKEVEANSPDKFGASTPGAALKNILQKRQREN
jgi:hypothetical protein